MVGQFRVGCDHGVIHVMHEIQKRGEIAHLIVDQQPVQRGAVSGVVMLLQGVRFFARH